MGSAPDIVVNGVRIGPQSDLFGMFRRAFLGEDVFPSRTAYGPQDGVTSVMEATRGTALEQRVTQAIMALLTDSDPNVRAGAVMAIETFPLGFDGQVLLRIMDEQPSLFRGIPATVPGYSDIYWELLRAIAGTGSQSREVLDRLKASVTDPASGHWLLAGLTRSDPDWVLSHVQEVLAGQPTRVNAVFANVDDAQKREEFLTALRGEPEQFRKDAAARLDRVVGDPSQRERLTRLLLQ
jgi:HEAT repeat protein